MGEVAPAPLRVSQKTLERLEWPRVLARLAALTRTPRATARLVGERGDDEPATGLFEASLAAVRARLEETSEGRAILGSGDRPPFGGVVELGEALGRARKGGVLTPRELRDLGSTLSTLVGSARFLAQRREQAPGLAERAATFGDREGLERRIETCIDPSGEVLDAASPALARTRSESRQLASQIQQRLEATLRDSATRALLSDVYFTVRNDRYVLPVRADARTQIRGIVHDASGSGTTLFVEPEALVELNNRHKQAELEIEREIARVLRDLSRAAAEASESIEADLDTLAELDLAFARAALAEELEASPPAVGTDGIYHLPQLRHPSLPVARAVPNDVTLGEGFHVLVISGPNAGGKTVTMKAVALAALFARAGLHVTAAPGTRVDLCDAILADIGDEQDIGENLSTFSAHMANVAEIVDAASPRSLVVLDEIGVGTDPGEGAALAQAVLEGLADTGARVIATTHYNLLKEMADVDPRFANASVDFDEESLAPTYRLRMGLPGNSSARAVAARMGLRAEVLQRANEFLQHEDRRLDRMLSELSASRSALEREQREAASLREQTEAARAEYRTKLERLHERRDKLFATMRSDLDESFRDARTQIAAVIRDLQRGGTAQAAARARERLEHIADAARDAQAPLAPRPEETLEPLDWRTARPGDAVRVLGAGVGVLRALPDQRGRVAVGLGSARVLVPMARVGRAASDESARPARQAPRVRVESRGDAGDPTDASRCDLRGLRVDEALDRLGEALDRAVSSGRHDLAIVHGIGKGVLRQAVRAHLGDSRYVARFEDAPAGQGGDGVTIALLETT